jgi:hypothetical protein
MNVNRTARGVLALIVNSSESTNKISLSVFKSLLPIAHVGNNPKPIG